MNTKGRNIFTLLPLLMFSFFLFPSCDEWGPYSPWPAARDPRIYATNFPEWTFSMRLWPFDILTPEMSDAEIDERLGSTVEVSANVVIFYIESEHMFETFVVEEGFQKVIERIKYLTLRAGALGLKTIVYVNGLEVMTRGAYDENCNSTGIPTMANSYPDWLQRDLDDATIVYGCQSSGWLEPDWEDAWVSPYSGYRDFFKKRIEELASARVDGIYIDVCFLPGFQPDEEHFRWGSTDPAFAAAFKEYTGFEVPEEEDLESEVFRAFLSFRHIAIADYLEDLAKTAWDNGLVPFWESSTGDTPEGTRLGNETAVTGRCGLGFSPEVETGGDWLVALRMAKTARELNQERPMIYLSWPTGKDEATMEFAVAIAHSNNYYPTADSPIPEGAFDLLDCLEEMFDRRVPYGGDVALVYSVRNKDCTLNDSSFFDCYVEAYGKLIARHIPFKIVTLEYLQEEGLEGITTAILPGLQGISDEEAAILSKKRVVPVGERVGTRNENWNIRDNPLIFSQQVTLNDITPALPFGLDASEGTVIEYYGDLEGKHTMYLFAVSPNPSGMITLNAAPGRELTVTVYRLGNTSTEQSGYEVEIVVDSPLMVLAVSEK